MGYPCLPLSYCWGARLIVVTSQFGGPWDGVAQTARSFPQPTWMSVCVVAVCYRSSILDPIKILKV